MIEYNHCRVDFTSILPKLFMEIADPDLPSSKGIFSLLFSSSYHSVIDHEELCKFTVFIIRCVIPYSFEFLWS